MNWRSSMSRWELFCISQAFHSELLLGNENSKKHRSFFRRSDAKSKREISRTFARKFDEFSKEQSTKFGDFCLHYYRTILHEYNMLKHSKTKINLEIKSSTITYQLLQVIVLPISVDHWWKFFLIDNGHGFSNNII